MEKKSKDEKTLFDGDDFLFKRYLKDCNIYFEYGVGDSTTWVLENTSSRIISVDTDKKWINKIDIPWLKKATGETKMIVTLENHYRESGVGSLYISEMASEGLLENRKTLNIGIDELPKCGRNEEVLEYHGLTAEQISKKIIQKFNS